MAHNKKQMNAITTLQPAAVNLLGAKQSVTQADMLSGDISFARHTSEVQSSSTMLTLRGRMSYF